MYREGDNIIVTLKLPGIKKEDISIEFSEDEEGIYINIKGDSLGFIPIQTSIDVPNIVAELELGILKLIIPKKTKRTAIAIK